MNNTVRAKKSLGQNWLVNEGVLSRIVEAAQLVATDTVLEIGPGRGALTAQLAVTGARVIAIEKDHRLIEPLCEQFVKLPNVEIIEGDVLGLELMDYGLSPGNWKLVANIPYYLTSHLIRLVLEEWPSPSLAVLMVQYEVARRMMATPPEMNLLALSVQLYATPEIIMRVSPGSFRPMPEVDSAVVKIVPKDLGLSQKGQNKKILEIAKKAFGQKRKQLTATIAPEVLEGAEIAPTRRPQELSLDEWRKIAAGLH